jgi:hypothetical protein
MLLNKQQGAASYFSGAPVLLLIRDSPKSGEDTDS